MKQIEIKCRGAGTANISDLYPMQGALKTLPKKNYEKLKAKILELGFSEPFSTWASPAGELKILNGHQRLAALKRMQGEGYDVPLLPINIVEADDEKQAFKKILSLTSQFGEMTAESLYGFMTANDIDLAYVDESFRFAEVEDAELKKLFNVETAPAESESNEQTEIPATAPITLGDLFHLGSHKLLCGDSSQIGEVERLLSLNTVDVLYTDPPYGIAEKCDRVAAKRGGAASAGRYADIQGDETSQAAKDCVALALTLDIPVMVIWGANHFAHALPESPNWLVWDKRVDEKQNDDNSDCELAWVKSKFKSARIFRHLWKGMIKGSEKGEKRVHPTQKPVALAEWCFNEYAPESKTVLDLFGGSGSTLMACEKTGRKALIMEIAPVYVAAMLNRWQEKTGAKAMRSDGVSWDEINLRAAEKTDQSKLSTSP